MAPPMDKRPDGGEGNHKYVSETHYVVEVRERRMTLFLPWPLVKYYN
jgi:hypothetical protein